MGQTADMIAAAPDNWRKTARRPGFADPVLAGLFMEQTDAFTAGQARADDTSWTFEADKDAALAFGLSIRDNLEIDGEVYRIASLLTPYADSLTAVLRKVSP